MNKKVKTIKFFKDPYWVCNNCGKKFYYLVTECDECFSSVYKQD